MSSEYDGLVIESRQELKAFREVILAAVGTKRMGWYIDGREFFVPDDRKFIDDMAETLEGGFTFKKEQARDAITTVGEIWEYFDEQIPMANEANPPFLKIISLVQTA
jgi:hypothetical protein